MQALKLFLRIEHDNHGVTHLSAGAAVPLLERAPDLVVVVHLGGGAAAVLVQDKELGLVRWKPVPVRGLGVVGEIQVSESHLGISERSQESHHKNSPWSGRLGREALPDLLC